MAASGEQVGMIESDKHSSQEQLRFTEHRELLAALLSLLCE